MKKKPTLHAKMCTSVFSFIPQGNEKKKKKKKKTNKQTKKLSILII